MLLLDDLRLAQNFEASRTEHRPRISCAERLKYTQILRKLEAKSRCRHFCINAKRRNQIILSQTRGCMFIQAAAQLGDALASNCQASRVRMSSKFVQQIATGSQPIEQVVRINASRRPVPNIALQRDDNTWTVQPFSNL